MLQTRRPLLRLRGRVECVISLAAVYSDSLRDSELSCSRDQSRTHDSKLDSCWLPSSSRPAYKIMRKLCDVLIYVKIYR